ncbi:MAG: hypothetical protein RLZZ429_1175 [Bacteroidota bacterium]|jgi:hypothetical protein
MKTRHLIVPLAAVSVLAIAGFITNNLNNRKMCSVNNKNCPLKQKKQVIQPQGSSPDELHYGGLNRLIVSTFR